MAKARVSINPMYSGGAGGYTFYVRDSEQVVRQRKNNSNYGESASRTEAQMARRVKWGNLVNLFRDMKVWQPKAYDSKAKGQTDYNLFMSLNVNSSVICLTKDQTRNGCAVMDSYQVSRGSLAPISLVKSQSNSNLVSDIAITSAITTTKTVGELSQDIIANNPQFRNGDNIAIILWSQFVDGRNYPYVSSLYNELTLDVSSVVQIGTLDVWAVLSSTVSDYLTIVAPGSSFGSYKFGVMIHTRKGDSLQVSTQRAVAIDNSVVLQFSGYDWRQTCIDSYGLNDEVPLDPSAVDDNIEWRSVWSGSIDGAGSSLGGSEVGVLPAGLYRVRCSPTRWSVGETTEAGNAVFDLYWHFTTGEQASVNHSVVRVNQGEMAAGTAVNNREFTLSETNQSVAFTFRADEGETISVVIERAY